jgi:hypothetical protein
MSEFIDTRPVEAHQWFRNGDHPNDGNALIQVLGQPAFRAEGKVVRYYRHPFIHGDTICPSCGHKMRDHGWIDNSQAATVCPGDWIITQSDGAYSSVSQKSFHERYKPIPDLSDVDLTKIAHGSVKFKDNVMVHPQPEVVEIFDDDPEKVIGYVVQHTHGKVTFHRDPSGINYDTAAEVTPVVARKITKAAA